MLIIIPDLVILRTRWHRSKYTYSVLIAHLNTLWLKLKLSFLSEPNKKFLKMIGIPEPITSV